jgi:hypothetical protein
MNQAGGLVALFGAIALAGCKDMPPPIGDDLPEARFPAGSDEGVLRAELVRERFVIRTNEDSPPTFIATYEHSITTCRVDWTIQWREDGGRIVDIGAKYLPTCL